MRCVAGTPTRPQSNSAELLQANGTVHQSQAKGRRHELTARDQVAVDLPVLEFGIGLDRMAAGTKCLDGLNDPIAALGHPSTGVTSRRRSIWIGP